MLKQQIVFYVRSTQILRKTFVGQGNYRKLQAFILTFKGMIFASSITS